MLIQLSTEETDTLRKFLYHEKDFLLSAVSIAGRLLTPRISGSLEVLNTDLEFINRLRIGLSFNGELNLNPDDADLLATFAEHNRMPYNSQLFATLTAKIKGTPE